VPCCVWRARGGVGAVMIAQRAVVCCVGRRAGVPGVCVRMLRVSVPCACVACWCLGDTRHDADVLLWWMGLVASCLCLCARVRGVMVFGSAALVGMCGAVRVEPAKM
jgi:hypothetical protein